MDTRANAFLDTPTRTAEQVCLVTSLVWVGYKMEYKWKHTNKQYNNVLLYENRHPTWYGLPVSDTDFGGF